MKLLDALKDIIIRLGSTDQDLAILQEMYRKPSQEATIRNIDSCIGDLMKLREHIKNLGKDSYSQTK